MEEKRLVVLTISQATNELFRQQLQEVIKEQAIIDGISLEQDVIDQPIEEALVLTTKSLSKEIDKYTAESSQVIFARRALDISTLEKLIKLPANKRALLINNTKLATLETKSLLQEVGIDHLELVPFYPEESTQGLEDIKLAINLGAEKYIPPMVERVINIGSRTLDLTTIVEILIRLDLLGERANLLITRQIKPLVELSKRLNENMKSLKRINKKLDEVINHVHDGIIYINQEQKIEVFNQMAEEIFGMKAEDVLGAQVKATIPNTNLDEVVAKDIKHINALQNIGDKKIVTTRVPVKQNGKTIGALSTFKDVTEVKKLEQDLRRKLRNKGHIAKYTFADIIGDSTELSQAIEKGKKIAKNTSTILIEGESGTGKELFSQAMHNYSQRSTGPFVAINCAALPENLLESELFGYEEGAFTGAQSGGKPGVFEQAHQGTIFLDEVGDIPLNIQTRLLRVLQEKEVMRIGATKVVPVDIRIIAATNKSLKELVDRGEFRKDLYYRLHVLSLQIPSLRDRREDIVPLIEHFLTTLGAEELELTKKTISRLYNYDWPGNIRELENCLEYLAETCQGQVRVEDLPAYLQVEDSEQEAEIREIKAELSELGKLEEYIFILNELYLAKQLDQNVGRREIARNAEVNDLSLSAQMVRSRLKRLEACQLVDIGSGRQGTEITDKGVEFLKQI